MKNILLLICICMVICTVQNAYAAFPVKPVTAFSPAPAATQAAPAAIATTTHKTGFAYRIREKVHAIFMPPKIYGIENKKGIFVTLALIAGILSFIPVYGILFGVAAIILGIIGMHRHQKLAKLGLILGCGGILANMIYLTIIIIESLAGFTIAVF